MAGRRWMRARWRPVGVPAILAARARDHVIGAPSSWAKSCAESPMRRSGRSRPSFLRIGRLSQASDRGFPAAIAPSTSPRESTRSLSVSRASSGLRMRTRSAGRGGRRTTRSADRGWKTARRSRTARTARTAAASLIASSSRAPRRGLLPSGPAKARSLRPSDDNAASTCACGGPPCRSRAPRLVEAGGGFSAAAGRRNESAAAARARRRSKSMRGSRPCRSAASLPNSVSCVMKARERGGKPGAAAARDAARAAPRARGAAIAGSVVHAGRAGSSGCLTTRRAARTGARPPSAACAAEPGEDARPASRRAHRRRDRRPRCSSAAARRLTRRASARSGVTSAAVLSFVAPPRAARPRWRAPRPRHLPLRSSASGRECRPRVGGVQLGRPSCCHACVAAGGRSASETSAFACRKACAKLHDVVARDADARAAARASRTAGVGRALPRPRRCAGASRDQASSPAIMRHASASRSVSRPGSTTAPCGSLRDGGDQFGGRRHRAGRAGGDHRRVVALARRVPPPPRSADRAAPLRLDRCHASCSIAGHALARDLQKSRG